MSMYGIAKGNEFESIAKNIAQAEANGVMMYYALARLAREQGFAKLLHLVEVLRVLHFRSPSVGFNDLLGV